MRCANRAWPRDFGALEINTEIRKSVPISAKSKNICVCSLVLPLFFLLPLVFVSSVFLSASVQAAVIVEGVRIWRAPERTRIVLDLSKQVEHNVIMLNNPRRLVLDLKDTKLQTAVEAVDLKKSPVTKIRPGVRNVDDLRLVFDLAKAVKSRSFTLTANKQYGDRLVVDLLYEASARSEPKVVARPSPEQKRDILIAIDAGHGGEDPGATGARRVREKNIVLKIAKSLARLFDKEPGFSSLLVRKGDYFLPLADRPKIAQKAQADLFLSIHADAFRIQSAHGSSVFVLSQRGSSSTFAKALADRENNADLIGGIKITEQSDDDVYSVLVDLAMTASKETSERIGKKVLGQMKRVAPLHKKQVEGANFAVLRSPDIPSLLIETGFISNPEESLKLSTPYYQSQLAQAIFKGVKEYFVKQPPEGSLLAWRDTHPEKALVHVIRRGETLSGIAKRYSVSMSTLKKHNGLKHNSIRIGQRLKIPG